MKIKEMPPPAELSKPYGATGLSLQVFSTLFLEQQKQQNIKY